MRDTIPTQDQPAPEVGGPYVTQETIEGGYKYGPWVEDQPMKDPLSPADETWLENAEQSLEITEARAEQVKLLASEAVIQAGNNPNIVIKTRLQTSTAEFTLFLDYFFAYRVKHNIPNHGIAIDTNGNLILIPPGQETSPGYEQLDVRSLAEVHTNSNRPEKASIALATAQAERLADTVDSKTRNGQRDERMRSRLGNFMGTLGEKVKSLPKAAPIIGSFLRKREKLQEMDSSYTFKEELSQTLADARAKGPLGFFKRGRTSVMNWEKVVNQREMYGREIIEITSLSDTEFADSADGNSNVNVSAAVQREIELKKLDLVYNKHLDNVQKLFESKGRMYSGFLMETLLNNSEVVNLLAQQLGLTMHYNDIFFMLKNEKTGQDELAVNHQLLHKLLESLIASLQNDKLDQSLTELVESGSQAYPVTPLQTLVFLGGMKPEDAQRLSRAQVISNEKLDELQQQDKLQGDFSRGRMIKTASAEGIRAAMMPAGILGAGSPAIATAGMVATLALKAESFQKVYDEEGFTETIKYMSIVAALGAGSFALGEVGGAILDSNIAKIAARFGGNVVLTQGFLRISGLNKKDPAKALRLQTDALTALAMLGYAQRTGVADGIDVRRAIAPAIEFVSKGAEKLIEQGGELVGVDTEQVQEELQKVFTLLSGHKLIPEKLNLHEEVDPKSHVFADAQPDQTATSDSTSTNTPTTTPTPSVTPSSTPSDTPTVTPTPPATDSPTLTPSATLGPDTMGEVTEEATSQSRNLDVLAAVKQTQVVPEEAFESDRIAGIELPANENLHGLINANTTVVDGHSNVDISGLGEDINEVGGIEYTNESGESFRIIYQAAESGGGEGHLVLLQEIDGIDQPVGLVNTLTVGDDTQILVIEGGQRVFNINGVQVGFVDETDSHALIWDENNPDRVVVAQTTTVTTPGTISEPTSSNVNFDAAENQWINRHGASAAEERRTFALTLEWLRHYAENNPDEVAALNLLNADGTINEDALMDRSFQLTQLIGYGDMDHVYDDPFSGIDFDNIDSESARNAVLAFNDSVEEGHPNIRIEQRSFDYSREEIKNLFFGEDPSVTLAGGGNIPGGVVENVNILGLDEFGVGITQLDGAIEVDLSEEQARALGMTSGWTIDANDLLNLGAGAGLFLVGYAVAAAIKDRRSDQDPDAITVRVFDAAGGSQTIPITDNNTSTTHETIKTASEEKTEADKAFRELKIQTSDGTGLEAKILTSELDENEENRRIRTKDGNGNSVGFPYGRYYKLEDNKGFLVTLGTKQCLLYRNSDTEDYKLYELEFNGADNKFNAKEVTAGDYIKPFKDQIDIDLHVEKINGEEYPYFRAVGGNGNRWERFRARFRNRTDNQANPDPSGTTTQPTPETGTSADQPPQPIDSPIEVTEAKEYLEDNIDSEIKLMDKEYTLASSTDYDWGLRNNLELKLGRFKYYTLQDNEGNRHYIITPNEGKLSEWGLSGGEYIFYDGGENVADYSRVNVIFFNGAEFEYRKLGDDLKVTINVSDGRLVVNPKGEVDSVPSGPDFLSYEYESGEYVVRTAEINHEKDFTLLQGIPKFTKHSKAKFRINNGILENLGARGWVKARFIDSDNDVKYAIYYDSKNQKVKLTPVDFKFFQAYRGDNQVRYFRATNAGINQELIGKSEPQNSERLKPLEVVYAGKRLGFRKDGSFGIVDGYILEVKYDGAHYTFATSGRKIYFRKANEAWQLVENNSQQYGIPEGSPYRWDIVNDYRANLGSRLVIREIDGDNELTSKPIQFDEGKMKDQREEYASEHGVTSIKIVEGHNQKVKVTPEKVIERMLEEDGYLPFLALVKAAMNRDVNEEDGSTLLARLLKGLSQIKVDKIKSPLIKEIVMILNYWNKEKEGFRVALEYTMLDSGPQGIVRISSKDDSRVLIINTLHQDSFLLVDLNEKNVGRVYTENAELKRAYLTNDDSYQFLDDFVQPEELLQAAQAWYKKDHSQLNS